MHKSSFSSVSSLVVARCDAREAITPSFSFPVSPIFHSLSLALTISLPLSLTSPLLKYTPRPNSRSLPHIQNLHHAHHLTYTIFPPQTSYPHPYAFPHPTSTISIHHPCIRLPFRQSLHQNMQIQISRQDMRERWDVGYGAEDRGGFRRDGFKVLLLWGRGGVVDVRVLVVGRVRWWGGCGRYVGWGTREREGRGAEEEGVEGVGSG